MAVDQSGNLTADQDARSTDFTGLLRDKIRKKGKTAGQGTSAEIIGRTCDDLRQHQTEVIVRAGYAVPLAAYQAIKLAGWQDGYDRGYSDCAEAAQELLNAERAESGS